MRAVTISFLGFLVIAATSTICFSDGNSNVLCIESERRALLKFKHDLIDLSNRLSSWGEDDDCCEWIGVFCNNLTGHVNELHLGPLYPDEYASDAEMDAFYRSKLGGKINPSLLDLKHLSFLDLSYNDFGGMQIPEFIGSLKSLTFLNLSGAYFGGAIPHKLGNLSKLHYLDLGENSLFFEAETLQYVDGLSSRTLQWVSGLSSLQYLDLSGADLSKATDWQQVTNKLPSLVELHLSACNLNNDPSPVNVNFTSLLVLDLSHNSWSSVSTWIFSLRSLVSIDLSRNWVGGVIPNGFQNMSSLKFLGLSSNPFSSPSIPNWLSNSSHLQFLYLRYIGLQGNIWSVIGNLSSITHLDVSDNQLTGPLSLGEYLSSLKSLDVSNNQLTGPLSMGEHLSSLKSLDVSSNRLSGTLPQSLGQLGNLEMLDVHNNTLEGNVSEMHFSNLTRLRILRASKNMLTFKPNPSWIPPFHCKRIELGNWHLGPQFPQWLQFQKNLSHLDISNAGISGVIPTWFWNISTQLQYVNLSHNQLIGGISYFPGSRMVDFSSNQFIGPLPRVSPNIQILVLSKNLFSGSLFHFLCSSSTIRQFLVYLDLGSNLLSGNIPDCWKNWPDLRMVDLGDNNLIGEIPVSLGSMHRIEALYLRNNSLFGEVPSTMQHLSWLLILDLSENQFNGSIPTWIGDKLSRLVILKLRSNKFQAPIPDQICALHSLQVLDLGYNNISGAVPKCLSNLSAMAYKHTFPQVFSNQPCYFPTTCFFGALLDMKGREDEYRNTLGLVASMDLSVNCLTGDVSKELGNLKALQSLNLSGNLLIGRIPESIGNMESLESLDLSMNRFNGEIPPSFSNLNFLNHLNLSYNNLTGRIPSSTQLQSFDRFAYIGNHLCGPPVTKNCGTKGATPIPNVTNGGSEGRKGPKVNGLPMSIVIGFVMGFWGVVAPLFFIRSWRIAYYQKLDSIGRRLYVFWASSGV